ncbi:MAG: AAA family ATPase [Chloroflexi bacterium]|nr:AAA family ATPase [Chloroflexota bacterium]
MATNQLILDVQKIREGIPHLNEPVIPPVLIIVSGLPGTGKSYFSRQLTARMPFIILESDTLRKRLFATPNYSPEESQRLFSACHALVEELLQKGQRVIFDATNLQERHREPLYHIADRLQAKLIIARVEAPAEMIRQRLERRKKTLTAESISDADWEVYQRMKPTRQRISRNHFAVDTSLDITPVINKIIREITR